MKMDLVLNNLQRLICHKNQPTTQISIQNNNLIFTNNYIQINFDIR